MTWKKSGSSYKILNDLVSNLIANLHIYSMPLTSRSTIEIPPEKKRGIPLIISGPSGAGKTTLCRKLLEKLPNLNFTVSHTTRPRRKTDVGGRDYFFVSETEFEEIKNRNEFLEWADINGNFYGTTFESIKKCQENSEVFIVELDVQGAESLHKLNFHGAYIFILPPSLEVLETRLRTRKSETEESLQQRLARGIQEIKGCLKYNFILTNHDVEETVDNLISIVNAEKFRTPQYVPASADLQALFCIEEKG